jgi:hypothetical protein
VSDLIVEYLKWPGSLHYRLGMTLLGEDEAGVWAGSAGGGEIVGLDEDEFASNRMLLGYPEAIIKQACEAFSEVKERLASRLFPVHGPADRYTNEWFSAQPRH